MKTDFKRIQKWAQIFKDPKKLAEIVLANTLANSDEVKADIQEIGQEMNNTDMWSWYDAGSKVGDLIVTLVGRVPNATNDSLSSNTSTIETPYPRTKA